MSVAIVGDVEIRVAGGFADEGEDDFFGGDAFQRRLFP